MPGAGQRVARELVERCNGTTHVAVLDHRHIVYVAKADSSHAVRMVSSPGRRLPDHCTAPGEVLLAHLPEGVLARRLGESPPESLSERSIIEVPRLLEEPARVRRAGSAVEVREADPDVCCVAAPVRDRARQVVAVLSISVPLHRWSDERAEELRAPVTEGALKYSAELGG